MFVTRERSMEAPETSSSGSEATGSGRIRPTPRCAPRTPGRALCLERGGSAPGARFERSTPRSAHPPGLRSRDRVVLERRARERPYVSGRGAGSARVRSGRCRSLWRRDGRRRRSPIGCPARRASSRATREQEAKAPSGELEGDDPTEARVGAGDERETPPRVFCLDGS